MSVSPSHPSLPDSARLFRAVLEAAPIGQALVDPDGRWIHVNPALCRMLGREAEELLDGTFQDLTHPDDLDEDLELMHATLAGERDGYEMTKRYVRGDGSILRAHLTVVLVRDEDDQPIVFISQISDLGPILTRQSELAAADERHRLVLDHLPDTIVTLYDTDFTILSIRGALTDKLGYDVDSYIGQRLEDALPGESFIQLHTMLTAAREGKPISSLYRSPLNQREFHLTVLPVCDEEGRVTQLMSVARDITEQNARESELLASRDELLRTNNALDAVLAHTPAAVYLKDRNQTFLFANQQTADIVGVPLDKLVGSSLWDLYPSDIVEPLDANDAAVMAGGAPVQYEEVAPHASDDGKPHTWIAVKFPVRNGDGEVEGIGGISLDITERKAEQAARQAAESRFEVAFEHAPVAMALIALDGEQREHIVKANQSYANLLGRELTEIIGRHASTWIHAEDRSGQRVAMLHRLAAGHSPTAHCERRYVHRDGQIIWTYTTNALYTDADGQRIVIEQVLDISDRKHFEQRLAHLADHDPLTGLFNRRRFTEELDSRLALMSRGGAYPAALLALDLDGFKYVNDSLGHATGDMLVARIAKALRGALRETDLIARTGGDEFAVFLSGCSAEDACNIAEKLLREVQAVGLVIDKSRHAQITASIGIAIVEARPASTSEDLLINADIAMYDAKAAGKNRYSIAEEAEDRRDQLLTQQNWMSKLTRALDEGLFVLHAQPIMPCARDAEVRYELLIRMVDDRGDIILPGAFLQHAERFGLMKRIDMWVLGRAVSLIHAHAQHGNDLHVSVNLSARTIDSGALIPHLTELLAATPIKPGRLMLEITETAAITNIAQAQQLATQLRQLGCKLALDDFGAGFASFYYLKHLQFDAIKIDGEFIRDLTSTVTDQLVVRSVVDIARGLGAETIAEFVGDADTVEMLREMGVDYLQGFHVGRPRPVVDLPVA